jgi:acetolactate synthase-1/2/3 large subunit
MNIQEMSTLAQYRLPVKVFILNNEYMGMVRQWQELLHGGRYLGELQLRAARLREARARLHGVGLRATSWDELDHVIREMIATDRP